MENRRCGTHARCLDGTILARKYLSTAKTVRPEHQISFARSLRHALRVFCRPHNALQVAPVGGPHNEALVTNLETATKLLRIVLAILQSSDGRCKPAGTLYRKYKRKNGGPHWLAGGIHGKTSTKSKVR